MREAIEQSCATIYSARLNPPEIIEPDGKLHRFASKGKPSFDAGWYVFHDDGIPAGGFGDWRGGLSESWRADIGRKLSPQKEAAHRARVEAMRRKREAEDAKRFLSDGRLSGRYLPIGKPDGTPCIVEGYATGASIPEAAGCVVAVAFNAGNLRPVARTLRAKFPDLRLIVCADDDASTPGNPGRSGTMSNLKGLPETGFVRLRAILAPTRPIPVGKSTWWQGVKDGRFPKPVKLGPKTTACRLEEIRVLITHLGQ